MTWARLALAALSLASAAPAPAQGRPDPCGAGGDETACYVAHQEDHLAPFALPAAEDRRAAGDEIRRALFFGRNDVPVVAVEYRRAAGREPEVSIYLPRREGEEPPAAPALSAAVPLAEWERLGAASRHFDRSLVPLPPDRDGTAILICGDGGFDVVEVTDPASPFAREHLRRRAEGTCPQGLTAAYANELAETAVRLLPACGTLDRRWLGDAPRLLAACGSLDGDRMAAAEVYNLLAPISQGRPQSEFGLIFATSATLDWSGELVSGEREVRAAWLRHRSSEEGGHFFPVRLHGDGARRVRVEGVVQRHRDEAGEPPGLWRAPVELIFVYPPSQTWQVERIVVGPFARASYFHGLRARSGDAR